MTTFRLHQDVAVVEHDATTRKPREGGMVLYTTVAATNSMVTALKSAAFEPDPWKRGPYDSVSGWAAWDGAGYVWRLVPVCYRAGCENPVLDPYREDGDPLHREWCSPECHEASGEAWAVQHYPSGVAT